MREIQRETREYKVFESQIDSTMALIPGLCVKLRARFKSVELVLVMQIFLRKDYVCRGEVGSEYDVEVEAGEAMAGGGWQRVSDPPVCAGPPLTHL